MANNVLYFIELVHLSEETIKEQSEQAIIHVPHILWSTNWASEDDLPLLRQVLITNTKMSCPM